jgi:hypothetical protein
MNKIKFGFNLLQNMGFRYLFFRAGHFISKKTGFYKRKFPISPKFIYSISIVDWKKNTPSFLFYSKNINGLPKQKSDYLEGIFNDYSEGTYTFFDKTKYNLGQEYDWITNPVSKYKYNIEDHWSAINELSEERGDIKFVWEKARFTFLYDLIRYDYHYEKDCSKYVFHEIVSFIQKNPINQGPNYICSQEISLRILNWTFALYYYKDSEVLTDDLFQLIMNSIYWQIHHVFHNISFSRIAVRNNHAITETLLLYLSGLLFPFLPDVSKWSEKGKKWFEQEITYQIYDDGTYLQFSNNYHRVVVQLLTLGIQLAGLNNDKFHTEVYARAGKSVEFLYNSMDTASGMLPNYGSNDGALFFKLDDQDFRDFRPQLQSLSHSLNEPTIIDLKDFNGEDLFWLGLLQNTTGQNYIKHRNGIYSYPDGGFYIMRDNDSMTYIRCGRYKDRPAHADNLHIDIWYKGINVFRDNGSFLYNSKPELLKFFMGTQSHNTVILDNYDQMLKGPRFIWFNWSQSISAELREFEKQYEFTGTVSAFRYLKMGIQHRRKVVKLKDIARWIVEDEIIGTEKYVMKQIWHFNPEVERLIDIVAHDIEGKALSKQVNDGWYSSYYGEKESTKFWSFSTNGRKIITEIEITE